jgi:hypothetical protein
VYPTELTFEMIRILIADDHSDDPRLLRVLLETPAAWGVQDEAENG